MHSFRHFRRVLKEIDKKYYIICAVVIVLFVTTLVLINILRAPSADNSPLAQKTDVVIGVCPIAEPFSSVNNEGTIIGFESALVKTLIGEIYPNARVEFKVISSQEASYLLRIGDIDLAVGMLTPDLLKTQGLSLSAPYYTDRAYAYTLPTFATKDFSILNKQQVLMMELKKTSVALGLEEQGVDSEDLKLTLATSYQDAVDSVISGNSVAVILPAWKSFLLGGQLSRMDTPICTTDYCIATWTDNKEFIAVLNQKLESMRKNGDLDGLLQQWNIN